MRDGEHATLIFVNETCLNVHTWRTRGRASRGRLAYRQVCSREPNLNLVKAINEDAGVVYYELERGTMRGARFQDFLDKLEDVIGDVTATIVLDNAPVRGPVRATMRKKMHAIQALSAYSPLLNPIENTFSKQLSRPKFENEWRNNISCSPTTTFGQPSNTSSSDSARHWNSTD